MKEALQSADRRTSSLSYRSLQHFWNMWEEHKDTVVDYSTAREFLNTMRHANEELRHADDRLREQLEELTHTPSQHDPELSTLRRAIDDSWGTMEAAVFVNPQLARTRSFRQLYQFWGSL